MNHDDRMNSNIFRDPEDDNGVFDISVAGMKYEYNESSYFHQPHTFYVGAVVYYDGKAKEFRLALAENTQASEVAGVVSEIVDDENFALIQKGKVATSGRYKYPEGSKLYLSDTRNGVMVSIPPSGVIKEIGTMVSEGIIEVDIKRGYIQTDYVQPDPANGPYSKEELDEIIQNIIVQ